MYGMTFAYDRTEIPAARLFIEDRPAGTVARFHIEHSQTGDVLCGWDRPGSSYRVGLTGQERVCRRCLTLERKTVTLGPFRQLREAATQNLMSGRLTNG